MRWLKHIIPIVLVLTAVGIVLATALSEHSSDYGRVTLPQGGVVELPEGTVKIFYEEQGLSQQTVTFGRRIEFAMTPAGGGEPLRAQSTVREGGGDTAVERSQDLGDLGSVAEVEVPAAGSYRVSGDSGQSPGTSALSFGTDPFSAVVEKWRLLAILLGAALVIMLIPVGRRSRPEGVESSWSSDPRTPYA
jgi:hypothetical protein